MKDGKETSAGGPRDPPGEGAPGPGQAAAGEPRPGLAWGHLDPGSARGAELRPGARVLSRLKIHAARRGPGPPLVAEAPAGGATSGAASFQEGDGGSRGRPPGLPRNPAFSSVEWGPFIYSGNMESLSVLCLALSQASGITTEFLPLWSSQSSVAEGTMGVGGQELIQKQMNKQDTPMFSKTPGEK